MLQGYYTLEKTGICKDILSDFSDKYRFIAKVWNEAKTNYILVASIIKIDTVWGREVALHPDEPDLINVLNDAHKLLKQKLKSTLK